MIARHISCCFQELPAPVSSGNLVSKVGVPFDPNSYLSADFEFRRQVVDICDFVKLKFGDFILDFFLQGSLATLDYEKGWSDVDTFMVIKDDTILNWKKLLELRCLCLEAWELFLKIAPLQHHGFIVVSERDLLSYPSHYLPVEVLDYALAVIHEKGQIKFFLRSEERGALNSLIERRDALRDATRDGVLRHHPKEGVYLMSSFQNAHDSMCQLFSLLGYVMTVPAYLMDAWGKPCFKRDSFSKARPHFSIRAWDIVDRASQIRKTWAVREGTRFKGNAVPKWLQDILGQNYIFESFTLLDEAVNLAKEGSFSNKLKEKM